MRADGILFDKDGTLFDFGATWNAWAHDMIVGFSAGDLALAARIADALAYDLQNQSFLPESFVIAGTNREVAEAVAQVVPQADVDWIEQKMTQDAATAKLVPATPLAPLLGRLAGAGLKLGVMTNDTEFGARAHLSEASVEDRFDFIIGFDSGFGAKPEPTPLLAFADQLGLDPGRVVMVGDSTHDLVAGQRAGMMTVGVLTGLASEADLAPYADVVLPDIGHLPDWLAI